jgi:hypothetical protein
MSVVDRIVSELRAVLEPLPQGARLIPNFPGDEYKRVFRPPSLLHIATYAVIERRAMVPTVFAIPGQQPIELKPSHAVAYDWYLWLHVGGPPPPKMAQLTDPTNYVLEIRTDFDVNGPVPPLPLSADQVAQSEHFTLYRLRPGEAERAD